MVALQLMCAMVYNRGFIKCHHYTGSIDGETWKAFTEEHFPLMFQNLPNAKGKLFSQNGDPSQNSTLTKEAMDTVGCQLLKISPRSTDLNPVGNVLNNIRTKISKKAIEKNINKETFGQFCNRVKRIIFECSTEIIDRTIDSVSKGIAMVIKNEGLQTKC